MPLSKAQQKRLKTLGERVRTLRKQKGLTQDALALACNKEAQSIQRLEAGGVNPSYLYLLQICEGLEISITTLVKDLPE
jgi:putative transcriptional regulator